MSLGVVIATTGRYTLTRTLESLIPQAWEEDDEILLISDDHHKIVRDMLYGFPESIPIRHVQVEGGPYNDWGHTPRNLHMRKCTCSHLCHLDDDDVALPGMLTDMHIAIEENPDHVHLFRMLRHSKNDRIWRREGALRRRNVSTQNIVHPNTVAVGVWGSFYGGDSQFIIQTAELNGNLVLWHDVITCVYNPPADMDYESVFTWADNLMAKK